MSQPLLITLWSESGSHTFSFDEEVQSVVWIGASKTVTADDAIAAVGMEDGRRTLSVRGDWSFAAAVQGGTVDNAASIALESREGVIRLVSPTLGTASLHVRPSTVGMRRYRRMAFTGNADVLIGRAQDCALGYENMYVSGRHARLTARNGEFSVRDLGSANGTFVNGRPIGPRQQFKLNAGDTVRVLDLVIVIGRGFADVNCPPGFELKKTPGVWYISPEDVKAAFATPREASGTEEPFYPAPRLSQTVHPAKVHVDDPPSKKPEENLPVMMQIGPSFLMGFASVFMAISAFSRLGGGAELISVLPTAFMALAMIGGSVIWPIVSRSYGRKKDARDEERRERLYVDYLDSVETRLQNEAASQAQILKSGRASVQELEQRASSGSALLMSRSTNHDDFMDLRVGLGDTELQADIIWPQRHFTLSDDRMIDRVDELSKRPPMLLDVPLAFNAAHDYVAGILGDRETAWAFLRGLVLQICTLYSYREVKILLIADEAERDEWDFLLPLGHLHDDQGAHRLICLSPRGIVGKDRFLGQVLAERAELHVDGPGDYGTYYVVLCANKALADRSEAVRRIGKLRSNRGFSLIYIGRELRELPRECSFIIDLAESGSIDVGDTASPKPREDRQRPRIARMFRRDDVAGTMQFFDPDVLVTRGEARAAALGLSRVHLDSPEERAAMPESLGFLELFHVGRVEHLNIGQRWSENDASRSLQTPIGMGDGAEQAYLDLHESVHGPHGLVAGTTGSGKSEFIITYILSLCANYAPDEVAFVLIDYKGGGLAGAFDNERYHLPHLAGTITNLDGSAIRRSLSSIQSELRRRQSLFNQARDITGEATIDIYKYLSFYRQGVLAEPLPHLFIVADEFAELKQQEPEFMDELISAARIGRSLGVHLILATQKPSGVVNDQIWSNARFKVCLKVSDAGDSREMIQREDAARITRPGQYYLLVGYDESFSAGQAAYAGGGYAPSDQFEAKRDTAVEMLDGEGEVIARLRRQRAMAKADTSELNAVLAQIEEASRITGKRAQRLWLDPLPAAISLAQLDQKYGPVAKEGLILVAGEADDPENQRKFRYEVDLAAAGNALLYGTQGSDVDELMKAMLLSAARTYGPDELWMYLIDLGAGSLNQLTELPQCGDIALAGDDEQLGNLMRMLGGEVEKRRRLFMPYGGTIEAYNEHSDAGKPRIAVGIANLSALGELHEGLVEQLIFLTREGPRFGMHVLATATSIATVRMRLRNNFGLEIPTMMNDRSDYMTIIGSLAGVVVPHQARRGLVRVDGSVFEMQGASISLGDVPEGEAISAVARASRTKSAVAAPPIPRLPRKVHLSDMGSASAPLLPVGFSRKGIEPVFFDLSRSAYMLVMGSDNDSVGMYLRGLYEALASGDHGSFAVIDPQRLLGDDPGAGVRQGREDVEAYLMEVAAGKEVPAILVFTSIAQTIDGLSHTASAAVQDYISHERGVARTGIIAATEAWRVRSLYQDWFKVLSAYGNGVWTGGGFAEQGIFKYGSLLPEFRQPAERSDGFYVVRGDVIPVRLLEAADEPDDRA